ncbi:hypothetical protein PseudUWO310_20545 [Pseudanabaena sp. UWO310]|nr:hypothetical protein PseudUWO310_20545 [Pseudanabaena sp. UWO310]
MRTNQTPRIEWRRFAPPLNSWGLCPNTLGDSYTATFDQKNHKKLCASVAKQHLHKVSWFEFERKAL